MDSKIRLYHGQEANNETKTGKTWRATTSEQLKRKVEPFGNESLISHPISRPLLSRLSSFSCFFFQPKSYFLLSSLVLLRDSVSFLSPVFLPRVWYSVFLVPCVVFHVPSSTRRGLGATRRWLSVRDFLAFLFQAVGFVPFAILTFVSLFFRPESSPILQVGCHWHSTRGKILEKRINFSFETSLTHIRWKRFAIFSDCKLMNY